MRRRDVLGAAMLAPWLARPAWIGAQPAALAEIAPAWRQLPHLGQLSGRGSTLPLEKAVALKPDLIIDTGTLNDTYRSGAERAAQQTGIPYLLLDAAARLSS